MGVSDVSNIFPVTTDDERTLKKMPAPKVREKLKFRVISHPITTIDR
jgi:hypothetical protein